MMKEPSKRPVNLSSASDSPDMELATLIATMATPDPSWSVRYRIGTELNKQLQTHCTLREVAAELNVSRQNAHTEVVLALGSFACALYLAHKRDRAGIGGDHVGSDNSLLDIPLQTADYAEVEGQRAWHV